MTAIDHRVRGVRAQLLLCALLFGVTSYDPASVRAQAAPTAEQRASAADAFDRGTSAMLSRDYVAAAHWFEQANRLAPNLAALVQAIRANERAGNTTRAANLGLRLRDLYPDEEQGQALARDVIQRLGAPFVEVRVRCSATCAIDVNGALQEHPAFYVPAGRTVTVTASFPGGDLHRDVRGQAGDVVELEFEAPPPPPEAEHPEGGVDLATGNPPPPERHGLPRAVFWSSLALTVGVGATLTWSGIDTRKGVDAYEAAAAQGDLATARRLLSDGQNRELRTNILIGVTAGVAAATGVIAIFTDWGGSDSDEESSQGVTADVGLSPGGGMMLLRGRF